MQTLKNNSLLQGGKYEILSVLGQGSFGITYLAEEIIDMRKVAIKEFFMKDLNKRDEDGSVTSTSEGRLYHYYADKFKEEATNLAKLNHPNIVKVHETFEENGTYYYVMDYIDGQNLNEFIKDHPIPTEEAVSIARDIADGLIFMHEKHHMLHLDLKPGNIMRRSNDGHVFIIDFGLSKHFDNDGKPETSTTIGLGTPGYAPIEQIDQAKNREFRPSIDVYSLGATLYKLLTRETPPSASELVSDDELIERNLKSKGVNATLIETITMAMLPNYRKRIQTIKAFKSKLPKTDERTEIFFNQEETTCLKEEITALTQKCQILTNKLQKKSASESKLKELLQEKTTSESKLKKEKNQLNTEYNKVSTRATYMLVSILLIIISGIIGISMLFNQIEHKNDLVRDERHKNTSLQAELNRLETVTSIVAKNTPLIITDVEVKNGGEEFGETIYSKNTTYLTPKISYISLVDSTYKLSVKLYAPYGLSTGKTSPSGYSYSDEFSASKNEESTYILSGWGNEKKGHYPKGKFRYEIYCGGHLLFTKHFSVY